MTQPRKNILLISLDDAFSYWRYRDAFGARLQVPNLDRICARATAFPAAYCQVPVCGPSRSSFMSGLAPHQTGIFDNYSNIFELLRPDQMWSARLKEAGYFCSTAGKIHHGYKPRPDDIHDALYSHKSFACRFGPHSRVPHKDFGGSQNGAGTLDPAHDDRYYDHFSSQNAVEFLQSYDGEAPFYREVGFHNPHPPFKTPVRFKEMYPEEDFIMPAQWARPADGNAFADQSFPANLNLRKDEFWRKTVRNYFSGLSHADYHIGRVWDALQASPHAANTIVVITADHGYHMGDKGRFRKYTLWEEAAGVPLIIYDPDRDQGAVAADPVASLDVGPTVLDYAGLAPMASSPGQSLRPQVEGTPAPGRAVPTFWFGSAGIRRGDFRYIGYQDGSEQLYDLRDDPWQLHNLAPDHPETATLRQHLRSASAAYGLHLGDAAGFAPGPALYTAPTEGGPHPDTPPTLGQISFEPPDPDMPDYPGYRRYFLRPRQDMTVVMPNAYRQLYYAGDGPDRAQSLTVFCSPRGTDVNFVGGHKRFDLTVFGGRGDDRVEIAHEPIEVHLQAGNNTVLAGYAEAVIHGGSGFDRIMCQRSRNTIHGGSGDSDITCGNGEDIIHSGHGRNHIRSDEGALEMRVTGGSNVIELRHDPEPASVLLSFARTGLPQRVIGYRKGRLDLSDWAALGPARLVPDGADLLLRCGSERVRFVAPDAKALWAALCESGLAALTQADA